MECVSCKSKILLLPNLFLKYSTTDNRFELFCIPLILLVIKVKQLTLFIMIFNGITVIKQVIIQRQDFNVLYNE